jgi:DNA-binding NtrC family response regulator
MSGHGTIDTAVEATKVGASAFLEKPVTLQKLLRAVEQALVKPGQRSPSTAPGAPGLMGSPLRSLRGDSMGAPDTAPGGLGPITTGHMGSPGGVGGTAHEGPRAEQSFDLDRPLREARDAFEKSYFEFHLAKEGGSMTRVAEKTGLERTHLYRKLKQLGVDLSRNKRNGG